MNGVPQRSAWGLALFNIFIDDVGDGIECALSKFMDNTKLSGAVDTTEGRDAIRRDPNKVEKRARGHLMQTNRDPCKVLQLGWGNPRAMVKFLKQPLWEEAGVGCSCVRQEIQSGWNSSLTCRNIEDAEIFLYCKFWLNSVMRTKSQG